MGSSVGTNPGYVEHTFLCFQVSLLQDLATIKSSICNTDLRSFAYLTRIDSRTAKEVLCHEGESALALHILLEGECKVSIT